jgi:acyl-CoA synthetase (AMP-forming)/AMP-acid ligase II
VSLAAAALAATTMRRDDRVGVTLPCSILNVMIVGPLMSLIAGATTVLLDDFTARAVAAECCPRRLTMIRALVPATVYDLVHDDGIGPESLSTLREAGTGAAGLAEGLRVAFEAKFGIRMSGSYGLSEAPAAVCSEDTGRPRRLGSSGVPLPHVSISIRDPAGMPLPTANWGRFGWDRRVLARGRVSIEVLLAAGGMASWFGRRPTGPASLPVTSAASTTKEHCTSSVGRAT